MIVSIPAPVLGANKEEIALTDQLNKQIVLCDLLENTLVPRWTWQPQEKNNYSSTEIEGYYYPSDVRTRIHQGLNTQVLLTCASGGLCTMAQYPSGEKLWAVTLPQTDNPHGIELLDNGCIAVAASDGGYVCLYGNKDTDGTHFVQVDLLGAHSLLWDPAFNILWALGQTRLNAYRITGNAEDPQMVLDPDFSAILPILNGHDLSPVYHDSDFLLVIASAPFMYSKTQKSWTLASEGLGELLNVKSFCLTQKGDRGFYTIPNGAYQLWNTDILHSFNYKTNTVEEIKTENMAFYRARLWNPLYQ